MMSFFELGVVKGDADYTIKWSDVLLVSFNTVVRRTARKEGKSGKDDAL